MYLMSGINTFCRDISPVLNIFGQLLTLFKISLPIILIVLGVFDIGKAVISNKGEDVKKHMKNFFKKVLVCIAVFFVPTLCMIIFGFVAGFNDIKNESGLDYEVCYSCMFNPSNDECTTAVEIAKAE